MCMGYLKVARSLQYYPPIIMQLIIMLWTPKKRALRLLHDLEQKQQASDTTCNARQEWKRRGTQNNNARAQDAR